MGDYDEPTHPLSPPPHEVDGPGYRVQKRRLSENSSPIQRFFLPPFPSFVISSLVHCVWEPPLLGSRTFGPWSPHKGGEGGVQHFRCNAGTPHMRVRWPSLHDEFPDHTRSWLIR